MPLFSLGFRPFFLLASYFAVIAVPLWVLMFNSSLSTNLGIYWHSHEMVFGFSVAVLSGFLLTATQNWTGIRGVNGTKLIALSSVWLLGRVFPFIPGELSSVLWVIFDLSYLPLFIYLLLPYLTHQNSAKNKIFLLLLSGLFVLNLGYHISQNSSYSFDLGLLMKMSLDIFLGIIIIISGRIIPFFSAKALGTPQVSPQLKLDKLITISFAFYFFSQCFSFPVVTKFFAALLAVLNLYRFSRWEYKLAMKVPLLAVLYMGYLWLIIGFSMEALGLYSAQLAVLSKHALTIGCLSVLCLGMMTRVGMGHTGRPLAPPKFMVISFYLINLSAAIRCFGPIISPEMYMTWVQYSMYLWVISFGTLSIFLSPMLIAARPDGRES